MADQTAANQTTIPPEVSAAIIEGFAEAVAPAVGYVVAVTAFGAMLIPVLIALFCFSTKAIRHQPIFICNVASVLFGIFLAIYNDYVELSAVLRPLVPLRLAVWIPWGVMFGFAPWLSELVLALRLLAVYPPRRTTKLKLAAVFAFPVCAKIVRFAAVTTFYVRFTEKAKNTGTAAATTNAFDYKHSVYTKTEWYLQLFDNAYLSTIFIYKLYQSHIFNADGQRVSFGGSGSLTSRVRFLFWVAITNFVFPVIFNIILLIDLYVDPNYHTLTIYLSFANYYTAILGVVFATIWRSGLSYKPQPSAGENSIESSWRVASRSRRTATASGDSEDLESEPRRLHSGLDARKNNNWDEFGGDSGETRAIPLRVLVHKTPDVITA